MDYVLFGLNNNSYIIEITKSLKAFTYTDYGKYDIHITFYDFIRNPIFDILTTEKNLLNFMGILSDINNFNYVEHFCNVIFNSEIFCLVTNSNEYREYPTENEEVISLQFFRDSINGRCSRINISLDLDGLDTLIYYIYQILQDIPYLESVELDLINEFMHEGEVYV